MLDGTSQAEQKARMMLSWDVSNGVSPPELLSFSLPLLLRGSASRLEVWAAILALPQ